MRGIKITPQIEIDHFKLGRSFSEWNSQEQARFLLGAGDGFKELGDLAGGMQLSYIEDEFKHPPLDVVKSTVLDLLRGLLERLEG